jgi:type II secretory pathway component PulK
MTTNPQRRTPRDRGIVLAIVLVLIFVLITAVYSFQRRAIVDATIANNRLAAAEADALARGGLRIGEAVVFILQLKEAADATGGSGTGDASPQPKLPGGLLPVDELWTRMGDVPLEFENGNTLRVSIEDVGARLNVNALVQQTVPAEGSDTESTPSVSANDEAVEYLSLVLRHIIDDIPGPAENRNYDERAIAENIIDYMDADSVAQNGRNEDAYYLSQDPPYTARNGPFLSFDEIGLVEGVDPPLLDAMRNYLTVFPIGGHEGINLNRAPPWVLSLVYTGTSGDRRLLSESVVRAIWKARSDSKIVCADVTTDSKRCVSLNDVGIVEGSFYPETAVPAKPQVFRMVAEATVGGVTRRLEAIYDLRPPSGPQLLSWRRLRGPQ